MFPLPTPLIEPAENDVPGLVGFSYGVILNALAFLDTI